MDGMRGVTWATRKLELLSSEVGKSPGRAGMIRNLELDIENVSLLSNFSNLLAWGYLPSDNVYHILCIFFRLVYLKKYTFLSPYTTPSLPKLSNIISMVFLIYWLKSKLCCFCCFFFNLPRHKLLCCSFAFICCYCKFVHIHMAAMELMLLIWICCFTNTRWMYQHANFSILYFYLLFECTTGFCINPLGGGELP